MQMFWLDNCVIGDRSTKNLKLTLTECVSVGAAAGNEELPLSQPGWAQGTLMSCLSFGRISNQKGNEVLTQMACEGPVGSLAPGQTAPSSPPGTAWEHWGHTAASQFSQTLKLSTSFQDYDAHVLQRDNMWNICKHGKTLWSQTLPINYTWPLFLWYPKAPHLTMKARPLVCLYQWL